MVNEGCTPTSCLALRQSNPSAPSGIYTLNPGGSASVATYCDMTNDGGGWTLGVNINTDLGPIDLFRYSAASSSPTTTNFGINLANFGLTSATQYRLTCVDSANGNLRKMFIKGLDPTQGIFNARAPAITTTNLVCSQSQDFSNPLTGGICIGGGNTTSHRYYGNSAFNIIWALYEGSPPYALRHCQSSSTYFNKGAIWFR